MTGTLFTVAFASLSLALALRPFKYLFFSRAQPRTRLPALFHYLFSIHCSLMTETEKARRSDGEGEKVKKPLQAVSEKLD